MLLSFFEKLLLVMPNILINYFGVGRYLLVVGIVITKSKEKEKLA